MALVASRVYRGRDGRFGYIGETEGDIFVDYGEKPNYSDPPPKGDNPFIVYKYVAGVKTYDRTEEPAVVAHFEGRRLFAATDERPDTIWASAVDDYTDHDEVPQPTDAAALTFALASMRREKIHALIPREKLIALTSSAEWQTGRPLR